MFENFRRPRASILAGRIGLSRHSALSAAQSLATTRPVSISKQIAALVAGSTLIGIAVALLVEARLGLAPYDVLSSGISERSGLTLGQAGWALAAVFFVVAAILGRPPTAWGVAFVLLNGAAIDAASEILQHPSSMIVRSVFVPVAVVVMAGGISLVIHSGTTGGPFELLMAAGHDRGISRLGVRLTLDVGVFVLGLALGGSFGPATVFYGLFMGATIMWMSQALEDWQIGRSHRAVIRSASGDEPAAPETKVDRSGNVRFDSTAS